MSIPINPDTPHVTPPLHPHSGPGPSIIQPVDNSSPSLASSFPPPPTDAKSPQLSLAEFYGAISTANIEQKLQEFVNRAEDPLFRKKLMAFVLEQVFYLTTVITEVYRYTILSSQLYNLGLDGKASKINQALAAYGEDNDAINTFNKAIEEYNRARTDYGSDYQAALEAFEAAKRTFNAYVATRKESFNAINTAIEDWNSSISKVDPILDQMNAIREKLHLPPLSSTSSIAELKGLANYNFPLVNRETAAPLVTPLSIPSAINIQIPNPQNLIALYLEPQLSILNRLQKINARENQYRTETPDPVENKIKNHGRRKSVTVGGPGSSVLTASLATDMRESPFLNTILSESAFEAIFKENGGPSDSRLVDQIGALYNRLKAIYGLLSAGFAHEILHNPVLTENKGKKALEVAIALGNVAVVSKFADPTLLQQAIASIASSPSEQRIGLIDSIVGELSASLYKDALKEVAKVLELPGLMPQILAQIAGINEKEIAPFSQELFKRAVFAKELAKAIQISDPEADDLVQKAPPEEEARDRFILEELKKQGLNAKDEVEQAAKATNERVSAEVVPLHPLSSFLLKQLGTTTEMAALLKGQIVSILSPAVGMRRALQVAEDYGALIFTKANSITNLLQMNERQLEALSSFSRDARLYENYREATKSYLNPQMADDNPLRLGMILLLTGLPGGIAYQGVTSDNNYKHATSYPGILG